MYSVLIVLHSLVRWLVLVSLLYTIIRACRGYASGRVFTRVDNAARHWTATIAHVQLIIGFALYLKSPVVKAFWAVFGSSAQSIGTAFFGLIHSLLMLTAITIITIGSALAKRKATDREKFRTLLIWFCLALVLIFLAIPWPFSPLASRPYIRPF